MGKVILNDIINIISGGTPKTDVAEYWVNGTIGWLSINDFNNDLRKVYTSEKSITEKGLKESNTKLLQVDDLIISARGTVGVLAQIGVPMAFNQSCFGIRGKKNIVDNTYLYYSLKNYVLNIRKRGHGSVFDTINLDSFKIMEIDIEDDLVTQQRIASVLSSLDDKIELNNKINAELEAMAKTLYNYWFVQFDFPDANGEPYKSSGGKMVYNAELKREIPEGWEIEDLSQIANFTTGKLDSNAEVLEGAYPFFTCAPEPTKTDNYAFDADAVLIAGNNAAGNFHINRYKGKFNAYQRTYVITAIESSTLEYLYQVLKTETKLLKKQGNGSQTKFLTIGMLTNIKIYKTAYVKRFNEITNPIHEQQVIISKQNKILTSLRDWLLPMLMNGQVTVNKAYEMIAEKLSMVAEPTTNY